jgi:hypothetical protein
MMGLKIWTSLFLSLTSLTARAEYRAFELLIENTEKGSSRTVFGTLDHLQYPRIFPLNRGEKISYVGSWMCRENMSNFKKICAKPDRSTAAALPSTSSSKKP